MIKLSDYNGIMQYKLSSSDVRFCCRIANFARITVFRYVVVDASMHSQSPSLTFVLTTKVGGFSFKKKRLVDFRV
jgi:hypothetical protein